MSSLMINRREELIVSCSHCNDIKLLDPDTSNYRTVFFDFRVFCFCDGGNETIFVQTCDDYSLLQLDCSDPVYRGPLKTLESDESDEVCPYMCYIPPPIDALVLNHRRSSKVFAMSVEKGEVLWEFGKKKAMRVINFIFGSEEEMDCRGLFFSPKYKILLITDGLNKKLKVVSPENGSLIQFIDLPDLGEIWSLRVYDDQVVILHTRRPHEYSISFLNLLA